MTPTMRTVTWGDALVAVVRRYPGGMNQLAKKAREVVGPTVGGRSTFAKLYEMPGAPDAPADRFRAWVVLVACHLDPADWGIYPDDVPTGFDVESLADQVRCASSWNDAPAAHAA